MTSKTLAIISFLTDVSLIIIGLYIVSILQSSTLTLRYHHGK